MDKELLRQRPFYLNDEEIDWVYKTLGELTEDEKIINIINYRHYNKNIKKGGKQNEIKQKL